MRIATFLLSSAILVAACADNSETTAPRSRLAAKASGVSGAQADYPPGPSAKPVDQVGWTKITAVWSAEVSPALSVIAGTATCPAGTTLISGGHMFTNSGNADAPPFIRQNHPIGNTWVVSVANLATGAGYVSFRALAICAS
jgi:hypothetical protein